MPEQTLLAFDYGTKKIGVAIGNTLTGQARPLEILTSVQRDRRFADIEQLLAAWQPDKVIVGLPLASDGGEQYASLRCRRFANQLRGRFGVQVELVDERGSSMEAQQMLGTHAADDAMAAMVILQRYLDALARSGNSSQRE
ncbi:Holliday junction resolvase RuvX [Pollutimonas sp. M17]|uniref:Holliday junction resolvase RuvX n=1 Tax=Pollutimonas sp. M17 TaxID=2962065 RepID=UPI0021F3FBE9|nr:Holliday junction resolvase RuvX [Pollutimonas sp. M17]UYO94265.1 Holliday junction resolvase RuvX [Pollutimonas sp. M17]HWK71206.1 Holliday junction resolvase RuvX [Burkholderiaceae bacterium]